MSGNNIITFPKKGSGSAKQPPSLEEIQNNVSMIKHVHIGETISVVVPMLFEQLSIAGFDFVDEGDDLKYGAFIVESIRSMMMRSYDMPHPFQELADVVFTPDDSTGGLRIVEKIDHTFKSNFNPEVVLEDEE
jgi:hypothetical protein